MKLTYLLVALAATASIAEERSCDIGDEELVTCPSVEPPNQADLKGGCVELSYTVQEDGSVTNIKVIDEAGDRRWIDAAITAVAQWRYRPSDDRTKKRRQFTWRTPNSECSQSFSPADVSVFLLGTPTSSIAMAPAKKDDKTIGWRIYNVPDASHLAGTGLRNADVLLSVCDVPITDVYGGGGRDRHFEASFCCATDTEEPMLIFESAKDGQVIRVPFL